MGTKSLQLVDFITPDGEFIPGLVSVYDSLDTDLKIDEKVAILDAKSFDKIDYVFFRRYPDDRSSQVAAYIVDNSDERLNEDQLAELHRNVWLHGAAPLLYIAWSDRIDVLVCARGPDFWDFKNDEYIYDPEKRIETNALNIAHDINKELSRFSALRLADGTFWDDPINYNLANYDKSAQKMLIQAVVETDIAIKGKEKTVLRRLLLLIVLVKYLEDRGVFRSDFFANYHEGAKTFFDVLRGGNTNEVFQLLDFLEDKFDGDVFSLSDIDRQLLNNDILVNFTNLVEAKTLKQQRYLWKQFSFEHLPVEIISNLYQRFVDKTGGAVYTPPILVSLLLDYAMPYEKLSGDERILDPACGSGIFLVGAFKRLISVWRNQNDWCRPNVEILKNILSNSIFGIEIDNNAIQLTAFSMCLAICDALKPEVIWEKLKFDKLKDKNLIKGDFFDILYNNMSFESHHSIINDGFDIIIGNPPFESKLSDAGKKINLITYRNNLYRGMIPDKQSAFLFLEQSLAILRNQGRICLIQPSSFLYLSGVRKFRSYLLDKYKFDTIFDFTSIRGLFEAADPKVIAILASVIPPDEDCTLKHFIFRRTASIRERICFEIDHYDQHHIPNELAKNDYYVWGINLLGGGRLFALSLRLRQLRTISQYFKQKGWDYGEGFIVGGDKVKRTPASFLINKPLLPVQAFTSEGIDKTKLTTVKETLFRSAYTESRYTPPIILIKVSDSLPIHFWEDGFIAYSSKIIGIPAPQTEREDLKKLYQFILANHATYQFYCTLHGTQALISKATVPSKQDIDIMPYPENQDEFKLSFWEKALCDDTLEYMTEYVRLGQNSKLLKNEATLYDLKSYSSMFVNMLVSVYENIQAAEPVFNDGLICQSFYFGETPDLSWLTKNDSLRLRQLIYKNDKYLRTIRVFRFYNDNYMLIIKPNRLRYWIKTIAIRDADETIDYLYNSGY